MKDMRRILRGELIGLTTKVIDSENKSSIGIEGKVIDETKNTLTIKTKRGTKQVIKEQNTFIFTINGESAKTNGKNLVGRPEERIKQNG